MERSDNCKHLLQSLSEFVDGGLSDNLCNDIERHLAECDDCRIVVDTLRKTVSLYHAAAVTAPEVPTDVRERLFKRLELENYIKK